MTNTSFKLSRLFRKEAVAEPTTLGVTHEIVQQLLKGFHGDAHVRSNGIVTTLHDASARTFGQIVEGKRRVRVNFRDPVPKGEAKGLAIGGNSKTWKGGGVNVTMNNLDKVLNLLNVLAHTPNEKVTQEPSLDEVLQSVAKAKADLDRAMGMLAGRERQEERPGRASIRDEDEPLSRDDDHHGTQKQRQRLGDIQLGK